MSALRSWSAGASGHTTRDGTSTRHPATSVNCCSTDTVWLTRTSSRSNDRADTIGAPVASIRP